MGKPTTAATTEPEASVVGATSMAASQAPASAKKAAFNRNVRASAAMSRLRALLRTARSPVHARPAAPSVAAAASSGQPVVGSGALAGTQPSSAPEARSR